MGYELQFVTFFIGLVMLNAGYCFGQSPDSLLYGQLPGIETNIFQTAQPNSQQTGIGNSPFFGPHHGYNYITPASTYKTYTPPSPETRTSKTPPLALSLYPDDYQKFDKEPQTFFIPKTRNTATPDNSKAKEEFYVPRSNVKNIKIQASKEASRTQQGSNESYFTKTIKDDGQNNWIPSDGIQGALNVNSQRPSNAQGFVTPPNIASSIREVYASRKDKTSSQDQFTQSPSIVQSSDIGREPVGSQVPLAKGAERCTLNTQRNQPYELSSAQSPHQTPTESTSSYSENVSSQIPNVADVQQRRRLQILRALLSEYLSLTLQSQGNTGQQNGPVSTHNSLSQVLGGSSSHGDEYSNIPQLRSTTGARQPHPIYGAPYK